MLVALAIFSLAGLAIVRLQAVSARSAFDLRASGRWRRLWRAISWSSASTDPQPPSFGSETGKVENFGRSWAWTQGTAPLQDNRLAAITIRVEGGPASLRRSSAS